MKQIKNDIYHWMMINLPFKLMYKHCWIDSHHKMWLPRWGLSKKQIENTEQRANEISENIDWD